MMKRNVWLLSKYLFIHYFTDTRIVPPTNRHHDEKRCNVAGAVQLCFARHDYALFRDVRCKSRSFTHFTISGVDCTVSR